MRHFKICTILVIIVFLFAGCASTSLDTVNKIVSPENQNVPIQGKWIIDKCFSEDTLSREAGPGSKWLEKMACFFGSGASLGDNTWTGVNYKAKRVNTDEYFLDKYSGPVSRLGVTDKELIIINLSAGDKFLYEFIKVNDSELIMNIDGEYFHLSKLSDKVEKLEAGGNGKNDNSRIEAVSGEAGIQQSGVFLGIRRLAETRNGQSGNLKDYKYLTFWIASHGLKIRPVLQTDGIFLPRMSGFWKFEITKLITGNINEDTLKAYSVNGSQTGRFTAVLAGRSFWNDRTGTLIKAVNYIGNDYACIEYSGQGSLKNGGKWETKRLATLPVDNLSNEEGVKLSEIIGENGSLAVDTAVNDLLNISNIKKYKKPESSELERSFSLYRKAGHWFIKGRLEMTQGDSIPYTDYNINLIPPPSLVAYDELSIPWNDIKDRVPDATDAYTSPNKDIAIVATKTWLGVYGIVGGQLSETPLARTALQEGDSVIMAEWGLDTYMDKWEKAFIKYNTVKPATMVK